MKLLFLLSIVLSIPMGINFGSLEGSIGKIGSYLTPGAFKTLKPAMSSEAYDGMLKKGAKYAKDFAIKNPQIIIRETGTDAAGKATHALSVQPAPIKQTKAGGLSRAFGSGEKAFKPGMAQVVGLDGKKAHMVKLDRLAEEGAGIKRLQRLYGLAPPKLTAKEATAIGVGATVVLGGAGASIDGMAKHRKNKLARQDSEFQLAHGAPFAM